MNGRLPLFVLVGVLALAGCDDGETARRTAERQAREKFAIEQLLDPVHGAAEIEKQLRLQIGVTEGLIIVRERADGKSAGIRVHPSSSAWSVSCGRSGLAVSIGAAEDSQEVRLLRARFTDDQCAQVALVTAQTFKRLLQN
jgi:hypothetical protein